VREFIRDGGTTPAVTHVSFGDLATAAYCPRKCYYRRREDDRSLPEEIQRRRDLAYHYPDLLGAADATLERTPIALEPARYRERLEGAREYRREQGDWRSLVDPPATEVLLEGQDCRGIAHKLLEDPPRPSIVSPGEPPEQGVWEPQRVRAVAAAKALAWELEESVETAIVEYPAHARVRTVRLTTRNRAIYNRVLRTARSIDGPPPRIDDRSKCEECDYREECGVRTRSLRSLLP
jgi:CRISPR-associated exonuclease Cas4